MASIIKRGTCCVQGRTPAPQSELEKPENRKQVLRKREERKKDKKREYSKRRKEKDRELERHACTNRLILSLTLKALLFAKNKESFCTPTIQVRFSQSD